MDEEKPIGIPEKDGTPADPMCPPNYRMEKGGGRTIYIRCDVTPKQVETLLTHPGETLKDIAMLYTVTVADIMRANNMTSEAVAPGQQLNIPPAQ